MLDIIADVAGSFIAGVVVVTVASLKLVDRVDARRHEAENPPPPPGPSAPGRGPFPAPLPPNPEADLVAQRLALSKRHGDAIDWAVRTHYANEIAEVDRKLAALRRSNG